ncbi:hypothetical protein MRB53_037058 [Persea americana]|nr:hypothetical protein MRB53_037058 [Persea americana]
MAIVESVMFVQLVIASVASHSLVIASTSPSSKETASASAYSTVPTLPIEPYYQAAELQYSSPSLSSLYPAALNLRIPHSTPYTSYHISFKTSQHAQVVPIHPRPQPARRRKHHGSNRLLHPQFDDMVTPRDVIGYISISYYTIASALAAFLLFRHGLRRLSLGWSWLLFFTLVSFGEAVMQVASAPRGFVTFAKCHVGMFLLDQVGVSLIMLSATTFLARLQTILVPGRSQIRTALAILYIPLVVVAPVFAIVGCLQTIYSAGAIRDSTNPQGYGAGRLQLAGVQNYALITDLVGYVCVIVLGLAIVEQAWNGKVSLGKRDWRIVGIVFAALAITSLPLAYQFCTVYAYNVQRFYLLKGSTVARVLLRDLPEYAVVALFLFAGFALIPKGEAVGLLSSEVVDGGVRLGDDVEEHEGERYRDDVETTEA